MEPQIQTPLRHHVRLLEAPRPVQLWTCRYQRARLFAQHRLQTMVQGLANVVQIIMALRWIRSVAFHLLRPQVALLVQ